MKQPEAFLRQTGKRPLQTLVRDTAWYALSDAIVRVCGYVVFLAQTRVLTPSDYGIVTDFYGNYLAFFGILYLFSMDMTYFRFAHAWGERRAFHAVVTLLFLSNLLLSVAWVGCIPQLAAWTDYVAYQRFFYYLVALLMLDAWIVVAYAHLRATGCNGWFLKVKCLQAFAHIACSVALLCLPSGLQALEGLVRLLFRVSVRLHPLDAVFLANIGSNLIAMGFLLPAFASFRWHWRPAKLRALLGYALASCAATLFFRLNELIPRMFFRYWVPDDFYPGHSKEAMLGNLGTAFKLTLCLTLGINAFKYAAEPFFFSNADRKEARKLYSQTMSLFLLAATMGLLLFSLNVDWIARLLVPNPAYRLAVDTAPYLCLAQMVLGIYSNASIALKLSHKTKYISWIGALGGVVCLLASKLLLPRYGHWGCVYASLSSATAIAAAGYYLGQKWYPIPYAKGGFALLGAAFVLLPKVPQWPTYFPASCSPVVAYVLLNGAIVALFGAVGLVWYRRTNAGGESHPTP